jgi:hypothetical protein
MFLLKFLKRHTKKRIYVIIIDVRPLLRYAHSALKPTLALPLNIEISSENFPRFDSIFEISLDFCQSSTFSGD